IRVRHAVVLVLPPATVGVLMAHEPVAALQRSVEALAAPELRVPRDHAVDDLTLVEDDRLASRLAEMSRERPVVLLDRQLPVADSIRWLREIGTLEDLRCREESLDDVAARLRIARQPAVLKAPPRRHAACVGLSIAHILRAAEPIDRCDQMVAMRALGILVAP